MPDDVMNSEDKVTLLPGKYPSIETVFVRNKESNRLELGAIRTPEVLCVKSWDVTEKIDGTNVRVTFTRDEMIIRGRSDNATLHPLLIKAVESIFPSHADVVTHFTGGEEPIEQFCVTFYGEGYGAGIQKGGLYRKDKGFRCFDIQFGTGSWWLNDREMREACVALGIPTVPHLGTITEIPESHDQLLAIAPFSIVATEETGEHMIPEGIVAKPACTLLDKHGDRVMWKLTFREFR